MKNKLLHTITFALALYIAYIGGGINIYQYCCKTCESYGHSMFNSVSCCDVHEHAICSECNKTNCSCNIFHKYDSDVISLHKSGHCDVRHFEAPLLSIISLEDIDFSSPLVAILEIFLSEQDIESSNSATKLFARDSCPSLSGGRSIVVLKSSYLI